MGMIEEAMKRPEPKLDLNAALDALADAQRDVKRLVKLTGLGPKARKRGRPKPLLTEGILADPRGTRKQAEDLVEHLANYVDAIESETAACNHCRRGENLGRQRTDQ